VIISWASVCNACAKGNSSSANNRRARHFFLP
jgi:hypothetical protein